jgi:hypothetical protein
MTVAVSEKPNYKKKACNNIHNIDPNTQWNKQQQPTNLFNISI